VAPHGPDGEVAGRRDGRLAAVRRPATSPSGPCGATSGRTAAAALLTVAVALQARSTGS